MSRAGYSDDLENWDLIKWRGQIMSAIRGRRGQRLLSDLVKALDAMPDKRLIPEELKNEDGEVCALGAVGELRGIEMKDLDPEDPDQVAQAFDIAPQLAREIVYENDEYHDTPEQRWQRMRQWAAGFLNPHRAETPVRHETESGTQ